ncbi:tRNA 2-thiouridine synthesizing protein C [Arsukibacterium tuosuense]|uniref:tRNA 2-thiouridine synthesizing protein C n=1 Tax=Arsukibacterium tuosuense TaxID=1323745 RepID=A0A285I3E3_9GAMM|nr:sulfurtransferase complex subunit TusC [Arsukibacterium tuosuense]SNY42423.1 tRNA 2-thiouridine synthesizing protein C [Arsukibacterium tuosuense]
MQNIAIIQRQSPFNHGAGREALDLILALAAVEHQLTVIFSGDAVYQLLTVNQTSDFPLKRYQQSFKLFGLYDIEQIYVCQQSLQQRQLDSADFALNAKQVSPEQLQQLLASQQQIVCI